MTELLPCPFCGSEAELHPAYDIDTDDVDGYFVICRNKNCTAWPETAEYPTEAEAIEAWNTRAERTCHIDPFVKDEFRGYQCTNCGIRKGIYKTDGLLVAHMGFNYCPNCGAKVVEE